jgi:hypothetical protein
MRPSARPYSPPFAKAGVATEAVAMPKPSAATRHSSSKAKALAWATSTSALGARSALLAHLRGPETWTSASPTPAISARAHNLNAILSVVAVRSESSSASQIESV